MNDGLGDVIITPGGGFLLKLGKKKGGRWCISVDKEHFDI